MGEQHLDLLLFAPGDDVGVGLGDVAGKVPCAFARDGASIRWLLPDGEGAMSSVRLASRHIVSDGDPRRHRAYEFSFLLRYLIVRPVVQIIAGCPGH